MFMAAAALHGYHVLKPWGDSLEYDVGIEQDGSLLRVQVKSTTMRTRGGYLCQFRRSEQAEEHYSVDDLDLFASYVVPAQAWYLIPASVILLPTIKRGIMVNPVKTIQRDNYKYEHYRDAWGLLGKSRDELLTFRG